MYLQGNKRENQVQKIFGEIVAEISQVKWKTQFYSRKREAEPCGLQAQET